MSRESREGDSEAVELAATGDSVENIAGSRLKPAQIAPCRNDDVRTREGVENKALVLGADRIRGCTESRGILRSQGEEIHHLKPVEPKDAGKGDTAPDRGVVPNRAGRTRVEHDKGHLAVPRFACPPQQIPVLIRLIEDGAGMQPARLPFEGGGRLMVYTWLNHWSDRFVTVTPRELSRVLSRGTAWEGVALPFSLVPKERQFFVLFRQDADNLMSGLRALNAMLKSNEAFDEHARKLKDLEHQGDDITHLIFRELNSTFITPFDRDDIYSLASTLDDVLDLVEETADTIVLDGITQVTPSAQRMGEILVTIGDEIVQAIDQLDTRENMSRHMVRIHDLENQADAVTREAISELFRSVHDAVEIIKWKDVYALLEKTVDTTEDIANILENVTIKYA